MITDNNESKESISQKYAGLCPPAGMLRNLPSGWYVAIALLASLLRRNIFGYGWDFSIMNIGVRERDEFTTQHPAFLAYIALQHPVF